MMDQTFDLESTLHARVGTMLVGKYRLDRLLGIGGMAAVYAATHRNQAEFAVKMLHPDLSNREDVRSRFLREGYIANSVKHPGAVRVVDDDVTEDGAAFLVMELLHGISVEDLWFRCGRRIPLPAALAIGDQLLDVLAAAHAKSIVHRDIKPANLFLSSTGDLKVLDFGIARLRDTATNTMHAATQQGTMLGTPAFMAPEQARGRTNDVDGQTDVWAVGATIFALVTGELVHQADSAPMLLVKAASANARKLGSVASEVPPAVAHVIDKSLAFDKASRWPTAKAMRDAVREAFKATFREPLTREVLAAFFLEMDSAPATVPAPETDRPAPVVPAPEASSALKTKVEGPRVAKLQATVPLGARGAAASSAAVEGPAKLQATVPLGARSPALEAPANRAHSGLTTSQPVSTDALEPAPNPEPKKRPVPMVILAVLVVGLVVGVAALLAGGGRTAPVQAMPPASVQPPPVATVLPSALPSAGPASAAP